MYLTSEGKATIYSEEESFAQSFIRHVNEELHDVKRTFIKIGFRLKEADEFEYYKELGYQNITDLAEAEFGFKKTTTYELIKVYELAHDPDCRWHISKEFDKYSYSQLLALTYLKYSACSAIAIVKPTDSVRALKRFVSNWNEEYRYGCGYRPGLKTVDEYLKAYDEKQAKKQIQLSEYAGQLPGQMAMEIEYPQEEEPYEREENFSERSEKPKHVIEITEEPIAPMTDSELIKYCLKEGSWVQDGKFRIVRCHSELMRTSFVKFVKEEYGCGSRGGAGYPYKSTSSDSNGYEICRLNGGKIVLTWSVVAGYISRMIEAEEYLTDKEKEEYKKWQAKYDGFAVSLPTKQEQDEPKEEISERSEKLFAKAGQTNFAFLKNACCIDFAKLISKRICELPETFGEGMPFEERVQQWLFNWLISEVTE